MKDLFCKKSIAFLVVLIFMINAIIPVAYALGDDDEIVFADDYLRQQIIERGRDSENNSIDKDNSNTLTKKEMESLFSLDFSFEKKDDQYNTIGELQSFGGLEYATNLKFFSMWNYNNTIDLSPLKKNSSLINFALSGDKATISTISDLVKNLPQLNSLGLDDYSDGQLDIAELVPLCGNIEELNICGKLKNIDQLVNLTKVRFLSVKNEGTTPTTQDLINVMSTMTWLETHNVGSNIEVDLGNIPYGTPVTKTFADVNSIMTDVYDSSNYLYNPNTTFNAGNEEIGVNNSTKRIRINPGEVGNHYSNIYSNNGVFVGRIDIVWKTVVDGDDTTEINIPDANLKEILLQDFDIDGNKKITEKDLKNITHLWLNDYWDKPVTNLQGMQNMTNLKVFAVDGRRTNAIDLSPIYGLSKLEYLYATNCKLTNISFIENYRNLKQADFTGNPIDPEDAEVKRVIAGVMSSGGWVTLSQADTSPIINFANAELKQDLVQNAYIDLNADGEISEYEMSQVTYIHVTGILSDLQYATGLQNLNVTVTDETDITPIFNLTELTYLGFNADYHNQTQNKNLNLASITKLTKLESLNTSGSYWLTYTYNQFPASLKYLTVSNYYKDIDVNSIVNATNITQLSINSNRVKNIEKIKEFKDLVTLSISSNTYLYPNDDPSSQIIDLSYFEGLTKLEVLQLSGLLGNLDSLKKYNNLKNLNISTYLTDNTEIENMMNSINQLNLEKLNIGGTYTINLGNITKGSNQTINIKDICAITNAVYNKNSLLYIANPQWKTSEYTGYGPPNTIDVADPLQLDTAEIGEYYESIFMQNDDMDGFHANISIKYTVVEDGDKKKEINIPDTNLKNALLEEYDLDGNKKITEYDLINIRYLDIHNKNIVSLEGLQNCINLQEIYASGNRITDLTPILPLTGIAYANFEANEIQNISNLANAGVPLNRFGLSYNYIDTSKGSTAYNLLKASYIEELKRNNPTADFSTNDEIVEQIENHIIYSQNEGSYSDRNNEVSMEDALKQRFIEIGVDTNQDGKISRLELYRADNGRNELDLSGLGITDITPLKYINYIDSIDLSNNNISDISALAHKDIGEINASGNKISNISVLKDLEVYNANLSNNKISDISVLEQMPKIKYTYRIDFYIMQVVGGQQYGGTINLSKNYINVQHDTVKTIIQNIREKAVYELNVDDQGIAPRLPKGDPTGDEKINQKDAKLVLKAMAGKILLTDEEIEAADVNHDGKVNQKDAKLILKFFAGKITSFD